MNPPEKTEFFCPFCKTYVLKTMYNQHAAQHWNDVDIKTYPATLEEMKTRFQFLGMYDER